MEATTIFDRTAAIERELALGLDMDFAPARRWGAAGSLGVYVACRLREGRGLFDALADEYVQERVDDQPHLLAELAADTLVRDALGDRPHEPPAWAALAAAA